MKKLLAISLVCLMVITLVPVPKACAGGVFATEFTQILNYGQLLSAAEQQAQQVSMQIQQLEMEVRQAQNLPNQLFGQVNAEINAVANEVQTGQAMAYSMANLNSEFSNRFPGYGAVSPVNYTQAYRNWAQTSMDTTRSAMSAVGWHAQDLQTGSQMLQRLQEQASSSGGVLQALQVLGEIDAQQVSELQKLRALMLADIASKQTYQQQQIQESMSTQDLTANWFQPWSQGDNSDKSVY